jgi:hypothetical protein
MSTSVHGLCFDARVGGSSSDCSNGGVITVTIFLFSFTLHGIYFQVRCEIRIRCNFFPGGNIVVLSYFFLVFGSAGD